MGRRLGGTSVSQTPEILPLRCGTIRVPAHYLETNSAGDLVLPVYAYLITHPSGRLALFDARRRLLQRTARGP
jgi:hypothetical protein